VAAVVDVIIAAPRNALSLQFQRRRKRARLRRRPVPSMFLEERPARPMEPLELSAESPVAPQLRRSSGDPGTGLPTHHN